MAGQAATLQLIQAGPRVGYQHYLPLEQLVRSPHAWASLVFLAEAALVAWGCLQVLPRLRPAFRGAAPWRLAAVVAVFVVTSATLSRSPFDFVSELAFASLVQLVHLGAVVLFALALRAPASVGGGKWLGPGERQVVPGGADRFTLVVAGGVTVVAALLAVFSYQRHPHVPDEVVYLLQARYLAAGQLSMPLPPVPEAFNVDLMTYQATRWFSPVPPGWPVILAVGAFLGAPWLVNPVLAGVSVVLASMLLRELYPPRTVRLAVVLLATSPWFLFMAMNLMTHTATLAFALFGALAVARLRRDPGMRWALLGGLGIGMVGLIRPLEGAAVAGLLGIWSLGARGRRWRLAPSAVLTLSSLAVGALVLPYNRFFTGSARVFPLMQYTDTQYGTGTMALGFGPNRGLGWPGLDPFPGHGAIDVLVNANFNLFQTNVELHGWATGSLLVLTLFLMAGPKRREDWWMLATVAAIAGVHSFFWFSGGPDFGARYWYLILLPSLVLTARGLEWMEAEAERASPGAGGRVLAAAGALMAVCLTVFVPWRAEDKYYHYRGMRPDVRALVATGRFSDGILLVRGNRHPDYASAIVYNPIDLTERVPLLVWDRGAEVREKLAGAYPDRKFWIVEGPTVTGDGYRVAAGPLTPGQLVALPDTVTRTP